MDTQLINSCHARSIAAASVLLLLLGLVCPGCQDAHPLRDSAAVIRRAPWTTSELAPGLTWERHIFEDLFRARQSVSVLRLDLTSDLRLAFASREDGRETTSSIATRNDALAAVNGTFFRTSGPQEGQAVCFVKIDGRVVATTVGQRGMGGVTIDEQGQVQIIWRPKNGWETADLPASVLVAGPIIDWDGIPRPRDEQLERHPRTAVGISPDRTELLLVTVDGRTNAAAGMTLPELRELMSALGCNRSMNLDGGGSSTMWIRGEGIVNHPSDNGRFDHAGERAVANAVIILPPAEAAPASSGN